MYFLDRGYVRTLRHLYGYATDSGSKAVCLSVCLAVLNSIEVKTFLRFLKIFVTFFYVFERF